MEHPLAAAAVAAAWPGNTTLTRLRRRIALELASMRDGPAGPYSSLAARLSATLRAKCPRLVAEAVELCSPPDGSIRLAQLLTHGPGFCARKPPPEDVPGGAFLYCTRLSSDVCVVLDLPALIKWHSGGSPVAPRTPSDSGGGGSDDARPYTSSYDCAGKAADTVAAPAVPPPPPLTFQALGLRAYPGPSAASQLRRALVQRLGVAGKEGEDGLPPYSVPWRQLAPLVAASEAAVAHPSLASPAVFRAFLEHPASAGVFTANRIPRPQPATTNSTNNDLNNDGASSSSSAAAAAGGGAGSYVDCVRMDVSALRRAGAAGIVAAIEAAWPGGEPLQRLKRTAARVLSGAHTIAGPYSLKSGMMGNALIQKEPLAYSAMRGASGGLMSRLDESSWGGHLLYVRLEGKEGCLRLKLKALLFAFPRDEGRDLGLPQTVTHGSAPHRPASANALNTVNNGPSSAVAQAGDRASRTGMAQPPPAAAPKPPPPMRAAAALLEFEPEPPSPEAEAAASLDGADGGVTDLRVRPQPGLPVPVPMPVMFQLAPRQPTPGGGGGDEPALQQPQPQFQQQLQVQLEANDAADPWVTGGVPAEALAPAGPSPYSVVKVLASAEAPATTDVNVNGDGSNGSWWAPDEQPTSSASPQHQHHQQREEEQQQPGLQQPVLQQQQLRTPSQMMEPVVQWVRSGPEFESMAQHCCSAGQVGLAAHCPGGAGAGAGGRKAEVAAIYAPAAAATPPDAGGDPYGAVSWPAVVYLFECTAPPAGSSADTNAAAAAALRGLMENPCVVKVVHGCGQIASIVASCGAGSVAPLLDTRIVLQALAAMLPPLPTLLAPAPAGVPHVTVGPLAAVALAKLTAHVGALRDVLAGVGLWADRPELLTALAGRHTAALREDAFGVLEWASNPSGHEAALVAAARHLPELWEALTSEAVPWVAMAAAATAVETALAAATSH